MKERAETLVGWASRLQELVLMRSLKVTLISAQENIDETPPGQLMHGVWRLRHSTTVRPMASADGIFGGALLTAFTAGLRVPSTESRRRI
jgi:hypothetical protein